MTRLQLNATERELLSQVLKNHLATLEVEICHTDRSEFRALLNHRRARLTRIAKKLERPEEAAA